MSLKMITKKVTDALGKNSPHLLAGAAVCGVIGTTVLAVKATPKALEMIQEAETDEPKEIVKLVWKQYLPACVVGGVTIACIIGVDVIHNHRGAVLAGLYSLSENAMKEYQEKVIEKIGKNKDREIKDEIAKDKLKNNPNINKEIYLTGSGDVLCFDAISGRYFKSDYEKIRKVQNDLNHQLLTEMWISLNDVYYELGLEPVKYGTLMGWNVDEKIDFDFSTQFSENHQPCLVLDYEVGPRYNYDAGLPY